MMKYWGGSTTRGFGARCNINVSTLIPGSPGPGDSWIPLSDVDNKFHYVMMSVTGAQASKLSLDGGTEIAGVLSDTNSWDAYGSALPFYIAASVNGITMNMDLAFVGILRSDLTGKMSAIKTLLSSTICQGLTQ